MGRRGEGQVVVRNDPKTPGLGKGVEYEPLSREGEWVGRWGGPHIQPEEHSFGDAAKFTL